MQTYTTRIEFVRASGSITIEIEADSKAEALQKIRERDFCYRDMEIDFDEIEMPDAANLRRD